jgi:RecB family exonuclease
VLFTGPLTLRPVAARFIITYSKVASFRRCRRQYWFKYLSGLPRPADVITVPGLIGNAVHRGMRVLTETGSPALGHNEIEVYLRQAIHEVCGPGTTGYDRALECFAAGVEVHNTIDSVDRWAEKDVTTGPNASLEVQARADRVDRLRDGGWLVIDWKTGADFDDATDEQLDLAHIAARSAFRSLMSRDAEVTTVAWNLRERVTRPAYTCRTRVLRREDAVATMGRYSALARAMQETAEFPPIPGTYCAFCEWRDRCPEAEEQVWGAPDSDGEWAEPGSET